MIMYNTLIGVCAGAALILVPRFLALSRGEAPPLLLVDKAPLDRRGWAAALGVLGGTLVPLALAMTLTHPSAAAKDYIDTIFGEPALLLGVALLGAAWYLARGDGPGLTPERLRAALAPVSIILFILGIVLVWCTAAIIRFNVVGGAPVEEPITGRFNDFPVIENLFFALLLYAPAAVGCLLMPVVARGQNRTAWRVLYWCWTVSGIGFVLFSAMNYYTHTGLLINWKLGGPHYLL